MKRKLTSRSTLLPVYTTLPEVMKDETSLQIFRAFLTKEYSQENLDFILSVDRLLFEFTEEKVGFNIICHSTDLIFIFHNF